MPRSRISLLLVGALVGCAESVAPRDEFWSRLDALCGQAFPGSLIEAPPGDTSFADRELVMHVRTCTADEIRIPFHVGDDRSRTWVFTHTANGLRLKHDHRHEDGTEDSVTQYGGDSDDWAGYLGRSGASLDQVVAAVGDTGHMGTPGTQRFPADAHTRDLIPAAAPNVWLVEVEPGQRFAYALRRVGTERRFRIEFDLTRPVPLPPAPWGAPDA